MPPAIHVVVGAVLVRGGRALLVHRAPTRSWYADVWDVPGGHVEPGEAPVDALRRELREELAVDTRIVGEPLVRVDAPDFVMDVWVLSGFPGEPRNVDPTEHDAIAWCAADDLDGLPVAHRDLHALVRRALG